MRFWTLAAIAALIGCANTVSPSGAVDAPDVVTHEPDTNPETDTGTTTDTPSPKDAGTPIADVSTDHAADDVLTDVPPVDAAETTVADAGADDVFEDAGADASVDVVPVEDLPLGQPVFELIPSVPTTLVVGSNAIAYSVRSSGRPIAVKKMETHLRVHPFDEGSPTRSDWNWSTRWHFDATMVRLFRDDALVDPREYRAVSWQFSMSPFSNSLSIVFETEEVLDRIGHIYTVILPIAGTLTRGDMVEVSMGTGEPGSPLRRGSLTPMWSNFGPYHYTGPNVYLGMRCMTDTVVYDPSVQAVSFVWSDRSSPRHSYADCTTDEASDDWFTRAETPVNQLFRLLAE